MSLLSRFKRLFRPTKREPGWNWDIKPQDQPVSVAAPSITSAMVPSLSDVVVSKNRPLAVSEPQDVAQAAQTAQLSDIPAGKVVLGFVDGSHYVVQEIDPRLGPFVAEFVKAADRMMRPARWRKLFGPKVGL
ncbi:MAG: hypothetical protein ABR507_02075 [Actinomycetota bacterium]|nr:hypothetical protein [Actinomycetota bacterium]